MGLQVNRLACSRVLQSKRLLVGTRLRGGRSGGVQDLQDGIGVNSEDGSYNPQSLMFYPPHGTLFMFQNLEGTGELVMNKYESAGPEI